MAGTEPRMMRLYFRTTDQGLPFIEDAETGALLPATAAVITAGLGKVTAQVTVAIDQMDAVGDAVVTVAER